MLVDPKYPGNIGSVARVMKNFGFNDMVLVDPCELEDDAYRMAKHAKDILEGAEVHKDLEGALKGLDVVVGTTGVVTENDKKFLRTNISPLELCQRLDGLDGTVGILFGRENWGLLNEELLKCDMVVTIPTGPDYPVMNISHSVAVLLYQLFISMGGDVPDRDTAGEEKERLFSYFEELLDKVEYQEHKREKTQLMFKRIMGRAVLTKWEYHTLMGVLDKTLKRLDDYMQGN